MNPPNHPYEKKNYPYPHPPYHSVPTELHPTPYEFNSPPPFTLPSAATDLNRHSQSQQQIWTSPVKATPNETTTSPNYQQRRQRPQLMETMHSSELTSKAAPFVPKSNTNTPTNGNSGDANERMVQVVRGGCIFFVPESEAQMEEKRRSTDSLRNTDGSEWDLLSGGHQNHEPGYSLPTPPRRSLQSMLLHENLRRTFDAQNECLLQQVHPSDERYKEIPTGFHSMLPLDPPVAKNSHRDAAGSWGYPTHVYKVTCRSDGHTYALRRIDNVRTNNDVANAATQLWHCVQHPGILRLYQCFFANGALFFVTEFSPCAESLKDRYLKKNELSAGSSSPLYSGRIPQSSSSPANDGAYSRPTTASISSPTGIIPERLLWSYVCQILSALDSIHRVGMACRAIDPRHILLCGQNRVRINGIGVVDVLEYDSKKSLAELQREDLSALGRLILSLVNRVLVNPASVPTVLEPLRQNYSPELNSLVMVLVSGSPNATVRDVTMMVSNHMMDELQRQYAMTDAMEAELAKEYQNGRLLMLLLKLGIVNERPELQGDNSWSETGDRYLLKLFRDYLFHQQNDEGQPVIDFGQIIDALNQLDVSSQEKILLSSRDRKSMLIASFQDVQRCLEKALSEVLAAAQRPNGAPWIKSPQRNPSGRGRGGRGRGRGTGRDDGRLWSPSK